jgi:pyrimidine-specific ribonucleoside hydrolase
MATALAETPLHVLALGPLTNVASLLALHPELASRIESIVMVAARRPGLEFFSTETQPEPFPDFNFECDPAAVQVVLDSRAELVFAPWEVSSHVWLTADDLDTLAKTGEAGAYLAEQSRGWLRIWTDELGAAGFNPFDTLAVAWLTHPELIESFAGPVWIEAAAASSDDERAQPELLVGAAADLRPQSRRACYCQRPHSDFKAVLLERLAARGAG